MIPKKRTWRPWASLLLCAVLLLGLLPTAAFAGKTGGQAYNIYYRQNYLGPTYDIQDGNSYSAGAIVTLYGGDAFGTSPDGKAFAGWAQSSDGPVEYQAGSSFTMPDHNVYLYAIWADESAPPPSGGLDHSIVYRPNYPGIPNDIQGGSYSAGESVTLKSGDIFGSPPTARPSRGGRSRRTARWRIRRGLPSPCPTMTLICMPFGWTGQHPRPRPAAVWISPMWILRRPTPTPTTGTVQWTPAAGDAPALLKLHSTSDSGFYLTGGVTFPENTAVDVTMTGNTEIGNSTGPAITATGGTLTFFTDCMDENARPSIHGGGLDAAAISAPGGSVAFTGGCFQVFSGGGAADVPIRVEKGVGSVELNTEGVPAVSQGITADPTNVTARAGYHAELTVDQAALQKSNRAISYSGGASYVKAAIVEGTIDESEYRPDPQPEPDDHDDGPVYHQVVYRPGYQNGPNPVRKGGYEEGDAVTLLENPFPAPAGKVFAGWSEKEGGRVKYQPGETISMPSHLLNLYAVWTDINKPEEPEEKEKPTGPALNRADHMAYIQGYPDGRVGPGDSLTREQTAAIFYRLLDADSRSQYQSSRSPFPDVADSRWSAPAIATCAKAGIILGQSDGTFAPGRPITRAEFAAIAARFDSEVYSGPDLFPDIAGHWAAGEINRASQRGWVRGTPDGSYRPDDLITRAEAATLINRVLERAPETAADLLAGMRTFPDNAEWAWYYLDIQEAANGHTYERKADGVHETWTGVTAGDS